MKSYQNYNGIYFTKDNDVVLINIDYKWWALDMRSATINSVPVGEWSCPEFSIKFNGDKFTFFSPSGKKLVSYR